MGIAYFHTVLRGPGTYGIISWNPRFDGDFVHFPNGHHCNESFLMIPPEGWDCE